MAAPAPGPDGLENGPRRRRAAEGPIVLDRYRLLRRLGTGAFATVWLARDERLDRQVAVKILPRDRVAGGRFEREARAAARLSHPGVVTLYEAAVDDDGAYLVSELVRGATLDDLEEQGRLSDRDVLQIGISLCDALAHAHAHGVIHRDVKPSNVLIPERPTTPAQLARLTDFGVARVVGGDALTRTGDVIGTVAYMAPEQAQGLPVGAPADLFSLALVLYEGLTGVNPVEQSARAARGRRLAAHLLPLRRQRRELPRELGQAIDQALRPRAAERGSLEELRSALAAAASRVNDAPGVVAAPWAARTRIRPRAEHHDYRRAPDDDYRRAPDDYRTHAPGDGWPAQTGERERPETQQERPDALPRPRRVLAGFAAAGLAAWLAHRLGGFSPLPPVVTACLAGLVIAAAPRAGWLALTALATASLLIHGHAGQALLLSIGALVPVALAPRDAPGWPLPVAAPALGALGLAAAWPALAGLTNTAWRRASLAATGWLWVALWRQPVRTAATLHDAAHRVLLPLLTAGTLACCLVWALAAAALPSVRSRASKPHEVALLAGWAIALALGTLAATRMPGQPLRPSPTNLLLGALIGVFVAIVTSRVERRPRRRERGVRRSGGAYEPPGLA